MTHPAPPLVSRPTRQDAGPDLRVRVHRGDHRGLQLAHHVELHYAAAQLQEHGHAAGGGRKGRGTDARRGGGPASGRSRGSHTPPGSLPPQSEQGTSDLQPTARVSVCAPWPGSCEFPGRRTGSSERTERALDNLRVAQRGKPCLDLAHPVQVEFPQLRDSLVRLPSGRLQATNDRDARQPRWPRSSARGLGICLQGPAAPRGLS